MTIPEFLRERRLKQGLTQAQVAERFGVSRPVISYIENGSRKLTATDVVRLGRILGFTVTEFFTVEAQAPLDPC